MSMTPAQRRKAGNAMRANTRKRITLDEPTIVSLCAQQPDDRPQTILKSQSWVTALSVHATDRARDGMRSTRVTDRWSKAESAYFSKDPERDARTMTSQSIRPDERPGFTARGHAKPFAPRYELADLSRKGGSAHHAKQV